MEHPLRQWREAKDLTQSALAEMLGVDEMTISRWERKDTAPQRRHWRKIEEITGLNKSQFFTEAGRC